jgi:hypothetical protein
LSRLAFFYFPIKQKSRSLMHAAGFLCYVENKHTLRMVWAWSNALGGLRLMVPASLVLPARAVLSKMLPIYEVADDASPAGSRRGVFARVVLAVALLSAPVVDSLRLIYVCNFLPGS